MKTKGRRREEEGRKEETGGNKEGGVELFSRPLEPLKGLNLHPAYCNRWREGGGVEEGWWRGGGRVEGEQKPAIYIEVYRRRKSSLRSFASLVCMYVCMYVCVYAYVCMYVCTCVCDGRGQKMGAVIAYFV